MKVILRWARESCSRLCLGVGTSIIKNGAGRRLSNICGRLLGDLTRAHCVQGAFAFLVWLAFRTGSVTLG